MLQGRQGSRLLITWCHELDMECSYWVYYPVHCHLFNLMQLIERSGTRRFHLRLPDRQVICRDLLNSLWPSDTI